MTAPLSVRLRLPGGDERMITAQVADLRFSSVQRGGYNTAEVTLVRPISLPAVDEFSQLTVFDTRNGKVVWDGRLLAAGRSVTSAGQTAKLKAIGEGPASTKDQKRPYMVVDTALNSWEEQTSTKKDLSVRTASSPGSELPGLTFSARGVVAAGDQSIAWYRNLFACSQRVGAIAFTHVEGETDTHALDLRIGDSPHAVSTVLFSYPWNTAGASRFVAFTPTTWPDATTFKFAWRFLGGGTVPDGGWGTIRQATVYARLLGRDRQPLDPSAYSAAPWLKSHHVFTDVIARFCPRLDIANARLDIGTFTFTQLVWTSGITPAQVLDELLEMDPDLTWAVWERQRNGLHRTELRKLPTEVRYEASPVDGWSSPNPSSETYDQVHVRWKDAAGEEQVTVISSTVPALQQAGIRRAQTIDLGSEVGTLESATAVGNAFLADHRVPPSGGTLTVARRIRDRISGRIVMPWEVLPGELIRLQGVHSRPDALNATTPDGGTNARIAATSFSLDSMSVQLDLDVPTMTEQRVLAKLANARSRG